MRQTKVRFDLEELDYSCELMRALAHPLRLKIIQFIDERGSINVNKIYNTLKIEQSITSQHLRVLKLAGVVNARREGKFMHYNVNYDVMVRVEKAIKRFIGNL